jgi:hypothetical protein
LSFSPGAQDTLTWFKYWNKRVMDKCDHGELWTEDEFKAAQKLIDCYEAWKKKIYESSSTEKEYGLRTASMDVRLGI